MTRTHTIEAFAKANGVKPALFSANSQGACPTCSGAGVIYTDLAMMAGVATIREESEGKRFQASVRCLLGGGQLELPVVPGGAARVRRRCPRQ